MYSYTITVKRNVNKLKWFYFRFIIHIFSISQNRFYLDPEQGIWPLNLRFSRLTCLFFKLKMMLRIMR